MDLIGLSKKVTEIDIEKLQKKANIARGNILTMTTLASSGHPGGSMSTIDILMSIYSVANISAENQNDPNRDRIIVSHGHVSPAVYSVLAEYGLIPKDEAVALFRKAGSRYEGHIEREINGVEWTTGNLGQGLSAGTGFAVAGKVLNNDFDIYVLMGDGEQQKGQIAEARRFAKKYNFNNITVIIDYNKLQISGDLKDVMPSLDLVKSFEADGWLVLEIDGHNFRDILGALIKAKSSDSPVLIIANTVMGKGISFMENRAQFHGSTLSEDRYIEAMKELCLEPNIAYYKSIRDKFIPKNEYCTPLLKNLLGQGGIPFEYSVETYTDNRSAFGKALEDITDINSNIVVFDCDLASSVKTNNIEKKYPNRFFQAGIAEHHTAVAAGAASINGVISYFADFGMFGVDEVYNQHRLNGINETNLKLVTTHVGVDVGEDGKTHMCIDYIGLMRNIFGFKILTPADPNQTDRMVRYSIENEGNIYIAMGRSKLPIITNIDGKTFYNKDYKFQYGKIEVIRDGKYPIFTYGTMVSKALKVHDILKEKNIPIAVINISSPAFVDDMDINKYLKSKVCFTYEDHIPASGLFSTLANISVTIGSNSKIIPFGVTKFPCSGSPKDVYKILNIDEESVAQNIMKVINNL